MNEKLRFSFGHVLAFLSLVFILYITYMGVSYWIDSEKVWHLGGTIVTGINFIIAGIVSFVLAIVLFYLLMKLQIVKATISGFQRGVMTERIFLGLFVVACILTYIPFSHFWSIQADEKEVKAEFNTAIQSARDIFTQYDELTGERIQTMEQSLDYLFKTPVRRETYRRAIRLQLVPDDYRQLQKDANVWLTKAGNGNSVWNIFLTGNIAQIKKAISGWSDKLREMYSHNLTLETDIPPCPDFSEKPLGILTALGKRYQSKRMTFDLLAVLLALVSFSLLLTPYIIQKRNTRNPYTLFGKKELSGEEEGQVEFTGVPGPSGKNPTSMDKDNEDILIY